MGTTVVVCGNSDNRVQGGHNLGQGSRWDKSLSAPESILFFPPTPCQGEEEVEAWEPKWSPESQRGRADPGLWGFIRCPVGGVLKSAYSLLRMGKLHTQPTPTSSYQFAILLSCPVFRRINNSFKHAVLFTLSGHLKCAKELPKTNTSFPTN